MRISSLWIPGEQHSTHCHITHCIINDFPTPYILIRVTPYSPWYLTIFLWFLTSSILSRAHTFDKGSLNPTITNANPSKTSLHGTPYFTVFRWKCIANIHRIEGFRWFVGPNRHSLHATLYFIGDRSKCSKGIWQAENMPETHAETPSGSTFQAISSFPGRK